MKKKLNIQFLIKLIKLSVVLYLFTLTTLNSYSQFSNPFLKSNNVDSNIYSSDKRTILILFDASYSMGEKLYGETKLHVAKKALEKILLNADPQLNIGLRVFGSGHNKSICTDSSLFVSPGVNNRRTIVKSIDNILPRENTGTPTAFSLLQAVNDITPYNGEKSIILISDGRATCGVDPCEAVEKMRERGINLKINVVGFDVQSDPEAVKQLKCIATSAKGKYFGANNAKELARGLSESISKNVSGRIITNIKKEVKPIPTPEGMLIIPRLQPEKLNIKN